MKQAVVQLGAGPIQGRLVERIQAAGLEVIVVDRAEAPAGWRPGAVHVRAPIDVPEQIVRSLHAELARRADLEVVAVLTSTDLGVASVPRVAASLGLPQATLASIVSMDDKQHSKAILGRAGIRVPGGGVGRTLADIELPDENAEVVVKPVDSSGSRGVRRARGRPAIERAIAHALGFSDRFLIEECIEGLHLDVNGFVVDGVFELVSVGERHFTPAPSCVPLYGGIAPDVGGARSALIAQTMQQAVDAFGHRHGPVKADAIETSDGLVLLELAARFHGDVLSTHAAEASGQAPAAIHWLARLGLCRPPIEQPSRGAWFAVFADRAGEIESIVGVDAFRRSEGYRHWIPRLHPGDAVLAPEDNRALVGFGLLRFEGEVDLWRETRALREAIEVRVV